MCIIVLYIIRVWKTGIEGYVEAVSSGDDAGKGDILTESRVSRASACGVSLPDLNRLCCRKRTSGYPVCYISSTIFANHNLFLHHETMYNFPQRVAGLFAVTQCTDGASHNNDSYC